MTARDFWSELQPPQWIVARAAMRLRSLERGEVLIERGRPSDSLFVVTFGLFNVIAAEGRVVAQIGANQLIGEMGFFSGEPRLAKVAAARASEVLEIDRATFDRLCEKIPDLFRAVIRSLAQRLMDVARIAHQSEARADAAGVRVVALVAAGGSAPLGAIAEGLRKSLDKLCRTRLATSADVPMEIASGGSFAGWFGALERLYDIVLCIADDSLTPWTQFALACADQVLLVAAGTPKPPDAVEGHALKQFPPERRRLLRVCERGQTKGGAGWLRQREVLMMHHVMRADPSDLARLARFLVGCALGYVAGGAGFSGVAHIGIIEAFRARGIEFDIFGATGTSAAAAAAFATGMTQERMEVLLDEAWARVRLLPRSPRSPDRVFDGAAWSEVLREAFGASVEVSDSWRPFFATTTDLASLQQRTERAGPLWQAIRAASATPGALAPFIDRHGRMLIDGGGIGNAPAFAMKSLKAGANVVVALLPTHTPLDRMAGSGSRGQPEHERVARNRTRTPSATEIAWRCMAAHSRSLQFADRGQDLILQFPCRCDPALARRKQCRELIDEARAWTARVLDDLEARGDQTFANLKQGVEAQTDTPQLTRLT